MWRIFSSPISPWNLVKSKYFFILSFSTLMLVITGTIGFLVFHPSLNEVFALLVMAVFLLVALGAVSLSNGIRGADFTEAPRARMIRQEWSLINLVACLLAAVAILAPFFLFLISTFLSSSADLFPDLYLGLGISAVISAIITAVFIRISINNANGLLTKAEI